jgi:hypothetical protein
MFIETYLDSFSGSLKSCLFGSPQSAGSKKVSFSGRRGQRQAKKLSFWVAAVSRKQKSFLFRLPQFAAG